MPNILNDLRQACRSLLRSPGFTALACVSIAVGAGLNVAVFSFANALLLRPLPVREPGRLVEIHKHADGNPLGVISYPVFQKLEKQQSVLGSAAVFTPLSLKVSRGGNAEDLMGVGVSGGYFPTLGLQAFRGRLLDRGDDGPVGSRRDLVVTHKYWRDQLAEDPQAVGRMFKINGRDYTLAGVLPPSFKGLYEGIAPDFYVPLANYDELSPSQKGVLEREGTNFLFGIGRLKAGVSRPQASQFLARLSPALFAGSPGQADADRPFLSLEPLSQMPSFLVGQARIGLLVIQILVFLVLGVAMSNVTHLLLVRAVARRKETAIRLALGAGRWQLVRPLLLESMVLSLLGMGFGLGLAALGLRALLALPLPTPMPITPDLGLDGRVLLFALLLALGSGLLFGLVPAWQSTRSNLIQVLREETATGSRATMNIRRAFVIAQVAVALILLVTSGLFLRSLGKSSTMDLGFEQRRALLFELEPDQLGYSREQAMAFYGSLRERLRALPGTEGSALCTVAPLGLGGMNGDYRIQGQDPGSKDQNANLNHVSEDYFKVLGIGLREGRAFTDQDRAGAQPVAIVNETLARAAWPGQSALGKQLLRNNQSLVVVGVIQDHKLVSRGETHAALILTPLAQETDSNCTVILRTQGEPLPLLPSVRAVVKRLDGNLPVSGLRTMKDHLRVSMFPIQLAAGSSALFGLVALILAVTGVFGVLSHSVEQRQKEIGIRIALGARVSDVVRLTLQDGMTSVAFGLLIGLFLAWAATRVFQGVLFGISATDPLTYMAGTLLLAACACLGCLWPALRAAYQDPSRILRS
jgi:predicted permease